MVRLENNNHCFLILTALRGKQTLQNITVLLQFVTLIRTVTDGDFEVIKLLQKRFNKARMQYVESDDFRHLLATTKEKIENDAVNKYVHIREFVVELKAFEEKPVKEERPVKVKEEKKDNYKEHPEPGTSSSRTSQKEKRRIKVLIPE